MTKVAEKTLHVGQDGILRSGWQPEESTNYRYVTSRRCGVALNVSSEMRPRVNRNSVTEQFRMRQFNSMATESGDFKTVWTAMPMGPADVNTATRRLGPSGSMMARSPPVTRSLKACQDS